ncbi:MAG: LytTR family transcriptional regulator [Proteobacteria bacterium]|nr:LytTR family transcriptional regulator [Pseudomonadota bacterium]
MKASLGILEGFKDYLAIPIREREFKGRLHDMAKSFGLISLSAFIALQFGEVPTISMILFYSLFIVGVSFTGTAWIIVETLYLFNRFLPVIKDTVGRHWIYSLFCFLAGYVIFLQSSLHILPFVYSEHQLIGEEVVTFALFLKILPLYFVVVYIGLQSEINKGLAISLKQAQEVNLLSKQYEEKIIPRYNKGKSSEETNQDIEFTSDSGKTTIPAESITHISVEEHYSNFFYNSENQNKEIQLRLSLKEALKKLPQHSFVQVHRSHIVNLNYISHIEQQNRVYTLFLRDCKTTLPISRHRVPAVLPQIKAFFRQAG